MRIWMVDADRATLSSQSELVTRIVKYSLKGNSQDGYFNPIGQGVPRPVAIIEHIFQLQAQRESQIKMQSNHGIPRHLCSSIYVGDGSELVLVSKKVSSNGSLSDIR